MHQITKWADNTGFQISIEKTKSILISRKNYQTVNKPTINIWIKGERIEQVIQHRILGLIFDSRIQKNLMNLIKCLGHTKCGADQQNLIKIHRMIVLSTLRYGEEAYGSASQAILRNSNPHTTEG
jgi:hypothetical protein